MSISGDNLLFELDREAELRILFSGGIESSVLMGIAVEAGLEPTPIYISIGTRWEKAEIDAAKNYLEALEAGLSEKLVNIVSHSNQNIPTWVHGGEDYPKIDANVSSLEMPARNETLIREAAGYKEGAGSLNILIGTTADNSFDDGTKDFFQELQSRLSEEKKRKVNIVMPLHDLNKEEVIKIGKRFPLEITFSCVAPIEGKACNKCLKCASRDKAFKLAG